MTPRPPDPPRGDHVHRDHNIPRPDPYAWMRHDGAAMRAHLAAERAYYDAVMMPYEEQVETVARQTSVRTPTGIVDGFETSAAEYHIERVSGRELLTRRRRNGGHRMVVLDPDAVAGPPGTLPDKIRISPNDRLLAYAVDTTGREDYDLRVLEIDSGTQLGQQLRGIGAEFAWSADSDALIYLRRDAACRPHQVWRHRLGSDPANDTLVMSEPDRRFSLSVRLTRSGRWIVISANSRLTRHAWLLDASQPYGEPCAVTPRRHGVQFDVEDAPCGGLLVVSDIDARESRLWFAPPGEHRPTYWEPVTPVDNTTRILRADTFAGHVVLRCRHDGYPLLRILSWPSRQVVADVTAQLAGGTVRMLPNSCFATDAVTVVDESYIHPPRWSRVALATGTRTPIRTVTAAHHPGRYRSERRSIRASDGARIPVTIVAARETPLDGTAPALCYSYGAYETCFEPRFDPALPGLLDRGVVFVHAHVRGGGERGRAWWLHGRVLEKDRTFTDLFDVADGLAGTVVDGRRMATRGMSAGGLVQGVALTRRPDRWRAVVAEVPWVDVVTSMCDETVPLVVAEREEWGDPADLDEFRAMLAYSPYDRLPPPGVRPALLVTGAVNDTRVLVREPAKWVAALRWSDPGWGSQCLFRCEIGAGSHAGPGDVDGRSRYEAEIAVWVAHQLGVDR